MHVFGCYIYRRQIFCVDLCIWTNTDNYNLRDPSKYRQKGSEGKMNTGKSMRVLIINQHTENYGDDCAAAAAIMGIRRNFPESDIDLVYHSGHHHSLSMPSAGLAFTGHNGLLPRKRDIIPLALSVIGAKLPIQTFSNGVKSLMQLARGADLAFVSPCGANIGIYRDWHFLMSVMAVVATGHTPIFHLNTIGRSGHFAFDLIARMVLRRSKVFVRERASYQFAKSIGISAEQGVDTAFSLPLVTELEKKDELVVVATDLSRWFKRTYSDFDMGIFAAELAGALSEFCARTGLRIRLIPHIHSRDSEEALLTTLAENISQVSQGKVRVTVDETYEDYRGYERRIAEARLVLSMRYHGVVLAAKNGVPFVSLSYENKMDEVSSYCGFPEFSIKVNKWAPDNLVIKLDEALLRENEISEELRSRLPVLSELAHLPSNFAWMQAASSPPV